MAAAGAAKGRTDLPGAAETLAFRLAREDDDASITKPTRVAALIASELTSAIGAAGGTGAVDTALTKEVPDSHVHARLDSLVDVRPKLG